MGNYKFPIYNLRHHEYNYYKLNKNINNLCPKKFVPVFFLKYVDKKLNIIHKSLVKILFDSHFSRQYT